VYTESLFFLLSLAAIYCARRGRWAVAGLTGLLAGFTRVMGWTLSLPLVWEAWQQRKQDMATPLWAAVMAAIAPALAVPVYAGIVGLTTGHPTAYFSVTESVWKQGLSWPWRAHVEFFKGPVALWGWERSLIDLAFTHVFLALAVFSFRIRPSYGLYAVAAITFPVLSGTLISMPRYVAVAFPVYVVLAQCVSGHRWRTIGLLVFSALLAALFAARFVTWRWIA